MTRLVLLLLILPASLAALEMDDIFPSEMLGPDRAEALLTADRIGPPATMFDAQTTTEAVAGDQILAIEEAAFGKRAEGLAAPDSLRRYGQTMMDLYLEGQPSVATELFVADHVGLPHVPSPVFLFATSGPELDDDKVAAMVRKGVGADTADGARYALTLRLLPEESLWAGVVWQFEVQPELDPFPRSVTPGKVVWLPGRLADDKTDYVLAMTQPGTEVVEVPIKVEDGRFKLELPMPTEPGVYRVAVASQKKNRMPDSPFFFSVHVGTDLPTAYRSPFGTPTDPATLTLADWEDMVVDGINALRGSHGLDAITRRPQATDRMREILGAAPKRDDARWRYYRRVLLKDPLPDEQHGLWQVAFPAGVFPEEALWLASEHPISRSTLLDPTIRTVAAGAAPEEPVGHEVLLVAMEEAPDAASASDIVFAAMQAKAPRTLEVPATLEAELDALAADVASGKTSFRAAMGPIKKLARKKIFRGDYRIYTLAVPPGEAPELDEFEQPSFVKYLAIGDAVGDLGRGDGLQWTVLVVVMAQYAQ